MASSYSSIMEALRRAFRFCVDSLEDPAVPWSHVIVAFAAVTGLRNFAEVFADQTGIYPVRFLHYYASYLALALSLIAALAPLYRTGRTALARLIFGGFILLNLAVAVDLVVSRGAGLNISYLLPGVHDGQPLGLRFLLFFGDFPKSGITVGMRVEIALACAALFFYGRLKGHGVGRSLLAAAIAYAVTFVYCALPYFIRRGFHLLGWEYAYSDDLMLRCHLLLAAACGLAAAWQANPPLTRAILRDARWMRLLNFEMLILLGFRWGREPDAVFDGLDRLDFALAALGLACAWVASVIMNNLADVETDRVSSAGRPVTAGTVRPREYAAAGWILLVAGPCLALPAGFAIAFLIAVFLGNYFLYSMPPFRLKRVPVLSKSLIAGNCIVAAFAGFLLAGGAVDEFAEFPLGLALLGLTLAINFIDLKDEAGDRAAGIPTLPVLLGMRRAQWVIGLAMMGMSWVSWAVWSEPLVRWFAVGAGFLEFALVLRRPYDERPVFVVWLISLGFLCFFRA